MKILLLGSKGQLGQDLQRSLSTISSVISLDKKDGNLLHTENLIENIDAINPDLIVNAAAYTAVDRAEDEKDIALETNFKAVKEISKYCFQKNKILIHFSTDYVYDGRSKNQLSENDKTKPINYYGHTKLLGDLAILNSGCKHLIFRISWVYSPHGNNFPNTIIKLCSNNDSVKIVNDQFGSPTSTKFIADTVSECINRKINKGVGNFGLYNLTPNGTISWYDFALEIIKHEEIKGKSFLCPSHKIQPISSKEFPTKALRPTYSKLSTNKIQKDYSIDIHDWSIYYKKLF